jgi:hypothetical protein
MASIRTDAGDGSGFVIAAAAMWLTEVIATTTRAAKPTPATATFCLFMGTGTRFECKNTPVAECIGSAADPRYAVQLSLQGLMVGRASVG